ncbi:MAG TPA: patatin-like phospholipase family protein [Solirubrobacteraceae bacterium]|jgi:NTE family protein
MAEPLRRPDVLVLGAGGTLGEAWMRGLLAGAEAADDALDFRECEYFLGTSAGSIVAAMLAAGRRPEAGARAERAYADAAEDATEREGEVSTKLLMRLGALAAAPLAPLASASTAPAGAFARAAALAAAPRPDRSLAGLGRQLQQLGSRFDGRLRIAVVDRRSGKRVMFGAPGAPRASVPDAVLASCAVPWIFAPVEIGGREYVDGGVWSLTNLDATPAGRGTQVLCLNPTASLRAPGPLAGLRAFSRSAAARESLVLKARGASVRVIAPDAACAEAMGPNLMSSGPVERVLAAAYAQGRRLSG